MTMIPRIAAILVVSTCLLSSGCQALAQWDRIGAGVRVKTVGWLESIAGLEIELFAGAERVPRTKEGVLHDDDVPDWYKENALDLRFSSDPE